MKNPTPFGLALLAAALITLVSLTFGIAFNQGWKLLLFEGFVLFFLSFTIFYQIIDFFIYRKIKLIYKTISTAKSDKLNSRVNDVTQNESLLEVEQDVEKWVNERSKELAQLYELEKYRKEFFGNVSHELKTPIFNIQGYIHTLLDGALEDPDQARKFLNKAAKSADRMEMLVMDLLTISELESGEVTLEMENFDVHELTKDVYESLELKARDKNITIGFKQGCTPPFNVYADRKQIRAVLVNLIVNAIKYGKEGGQVLIGYYDMAENYLIEVSDNGEGVEEQHLPRLFERFYRVDKARSRNVGGTGLGLAIVKHILEAHNQNINVRSTLGLGSTFGFTLTKAKGK